MWSTTNINLMLYALQSNSTSSSHKGSLSWLKQSALRASHELTILHFVSCSRITFEAWSVLAWSCNTAARSCTCYFTSLSTTHHGSNNFVTPPFACSKWRMIASTVMLLRRLVSWNRRRIISPRNALRTLSVLSFCQILDFNILEHTSKRNWSCPGGISSLIACWSLLWEHTVLLKVFKHCSIVLRNLISPCISVSATVSFSSPSALRNSCWTWRNYLCCATCTISSISALE